MGKANEQALSDLHGTVARVLSDQLTDEITIVTEDGTEKVISNCSPAMMAQAVKFLKDNNITSNVEDDDNLKDLDESLKAKRQKREARKGNVVALQVGAE